MKAHAYHRGFGVGIVPVLIGAVQQNQNGKNKQGQRR